MATHTEKVKVSKNGKDTIKFAVLHIPSKLLILTKYQCLELQDVGRIAVFSIIQLRYDNLINTDGV